MSQVQLVSEINIGEFLKNKQTQIRAALPKHLDTDRMLRITLTEIRKNPKLKECTLESLFGSVIRASQLGLEPGSDLGLSYLIPYENSKNIGTKESAQWIKQYECQFMIGYQGMIELARRSEKILDICSRAVYENDKFFLKFGLTDELEHEPCPDNAGLLTQVYGITKFNGGGHHIEYMRKDQIDAVRERSKASKNGPWVSDYDEMARKTLVRRMFKYIPKSVELAQALALDAQGDEGAQENHLIIEGELGDEYPKSLQNKSEPTKKADLLSNQLEKRKI